MNRKNTEPYYFLENEKFIRWRLTNDPELELYWNAFLDKNPHWAEEFHFSLKAFDRVTLNKKTFEHTDILYLKIQDTLQMRKRKRLTYYFSGAAAVLIILFITSMFLKRINTTAYPVYVEAIIGRTLPEEDIQLLVGDKALTLRQNADIKLSGGQVFISDSSRHEHSLPVADDKMNKLIVPKGKRSFLTLSDGSKIWVNSGTVLEFPSRFSKQSRVIHVSGEVFLDIVPSKNQPFIVQAGNLNVKVHGTRFNVASYAEEQEASVVLVEGSIEVRAGTQSVFVTPNEMLKQQGNKLIKSKVDTWFYTSWINGIFEFRETPVREVLHKVGRYYNLSFEDGEELFNDKITGKLHLSEDIDAVLSSISLLTSTTYKREDNVIKLLKDKN